MPDLVPGTGDTILCPGAANCWWRRRNLGDKSEITLQAEGSEAELWGHALEDRQEFAMKRKAGRAEIAGRSEWLPQSVGVEN